MISILVTSAILGYLIVVLESPIRINKTISSILTGSLCWIVIALFSQATILMKFLKNLQITLAKLPDF